jgi:hypothetical protein
MRRLFALAVMLTLAGAGRALAQVPTRLGSAEFAALVERFSEPGGYFDTDNLVSNEDSYLHAVTGLERYGVRGGAYLGVGPDQNFSYIAAIRPRIAFILDIRRDNLLEHLLFKALFAHARNRLEYLCLLFGKPAPEDTTGWGARDLTVLLDYAARGPPDRRATARARQVITTGTRASGLPLTAEDVASIGRFHEAFVAAGPELRLTTFGRPERADYPTYRKLLLETDLRERRSGYLVRETDFQYLKALQERNLIIPVVGNFAGPTALRAIGRYLEERGERISAFYTSNVEQYLFRAGTFATFAANVGALPHDARSVIIRSYFPYGRFHPQRVPGYLSVQVLQTFATFLEAERHGRYRSYWELVTRDILPVR